MVIMGDFSLKTSVCCGSFSIEHSAQVITQTNHISYMWTTRTYASLTLIDFLSLGTVLSRQVQWCMTLTDMGLTEYMGLTEKNATTDKFT